MLNFRLPFRAGRISLILLSLIGVSCGAPSSEMTNAASTTPVAAVPSSEIKGYSSSTAMNLSGELVPAEVQDYYFIEFVDGVSDAEYVDELKTLLDRTHQDADYLGIVGRDAGRLRKIVRDSLQDVQPGSLSRATLVVIARAQDEAVLRPLVEASGAMLRFGVYLPYGAGLL